MADYFSRKAVSDIARVMGRLHPSCMPRSGHPPVNLTVPSGERELSKFARDYGVGRESVKNAVLGLTFKELPSHPRGARVSAHYHMNRAPEAVGKEPTGETPCCGAATRMNLER